MARAMVTEAGFRVEGKQLDDAAVLHVTFKGFHVAYCDSPEQVAEQVGEAFASLVPEQVAA